MPRNDLPRFPEHARRDVHGIEDGEQVVRHVRRDSPEVRVDLYVEVWNKERVEQSVLVFMGRRISGKRDYHSQESSNSREDVSDILESSQVDRTPP